MMSVKIYREQRQTPEPDFLVHFGTLVTRPGSCRWLLRRANGRVAIRPLSHVPSQQPEESSKNKPDEAEGNAQAQQVAGIERVIYEAADEQNEKDNFDEELSLLHQC
jgi:hypothetical protein